MHRRILLVERDGALKTTLAQQLLYEGYEVAIGTDGADVLDRACLYPADLIIVGDTPPPLTGVEVCRALRLRGITVPVLRLTSGDEISESSLGVSVGANSFLRKPFEAPDFSTRVASLVGHHGKSTETASYQFGAIAVDLARSQVTRDGKRVHLTGREFQLLCYLVARAGVIISRDELLRSVWGYSSNTATRTVDTHVRTIRQKLEETPHRPALILTVSRVGYKLVHPHSN